MKNQIIENNPTVLSEVARTVAEWPQEQEEVVKEDKRKGKPLKRTGFSGDTIVQGIMWHEILSDPLCKRRRNK